VLGGTFKRLQFTPDLVPADLVGTRIYRPDTGAFDTELGPVFCNFLLADEINRAPAKVQSALLEVMQERQVTIGHETHRSRSRSSCSRRRTRSSPRAPTPCPRRRSIASCSSWSSTTPTCRMRCRSVERSLDTSSPRAPGAHARRPWSATSGGPRRSTSTGA
jgi:MoxR-like ATPase